MSDEYAGIEMPEHLERAYIGYMADVGCWAADGGSGPKPELPDDVRAWLEEWGYSADG
ncbi:hypothetical protein [Candidatus Poriferisodalis sp.]|uniref:hypothetical protein n=1 Tax=Candidatus Poriferisodalis sp. TaxID=3101277 RepID=UPI003B0260D2